MEIHEYDRVRLKHPLAGIEWIHGELAKQYGPDVQYWPEDARIFLQHRTTEVFEAWIQPALICINCGEKTISVGYRGANTHVEPASNSGIHVVAGHLPAACYEKIP